MQANNPALSPWVRRFFMIVLVVVLFGAGLLVLPSVIVPLWPWAITPFNAAFLGGVYISEFVLVLVLVSTNRWSPGRIIFPMALCFVGVITVISILSFDRFDRTRWTVLAWFVAYVGSILVAAYYLLKYRGLSPAGSAPAAPWRTILLVQGVLLVLYGLGLLVLPSTFSSFWPWKI